LENVKNNIAAAVRSRNMWEARNVITLQQNNQWQRARTKIEHVRKNLNRLRVKKCKQTKTAQKQLEIYINIK